MTSITAEQLLREAREQRREKAETRPPKHKITDFTDLADYRLRKRQEFESRTRRERHNSQKDFSRARSVWIRALEATGYRNHSLWVQYAEAELRNKFVSHARNVWDRAVTLLPGVDQLWYKYIHMEEKVGNVAGARRVFERWMSWRPEEQAWLSYIEFELRYDEVARARGVYERFMECHPQFVTLEKEKGEEEGIEKNDAVAEKKRFQYEDEVRKNPLNYDVWFDYIWLEESEGNISRIRDIYRRAIANVPPSEEKRYWQRYIYLWINYALYEELDAGDVERARGVYKECLNQIPHKKFSFAKIWILAAEFEIRQLNLRGARQILGHAIGRAPKGKIFSKYIEIELQLGNINRCRKLYEKYLELSPHICQTWINYAGLEKSSSETERARAIFELAIAQPALDMPELLWKSYIDFEIWAGEHDRVRQLYERLLERTKDWKNWISYAKFEAHDTKKDDQNKWCVQNARRVLERADNHFRTSAPELKEERTMLLEEWLKMERNFGELGDVTIVLAKLPKKLKRRRQISSEDGLEGYQEYMDYIFPEELQARNLNVLQAAYRWKKQQLSTGEAHEKLYSGSC
ncbi:hypothetical protein Tsubulata_020181 [Turnera subulata]|uniref:Pre-mRNA-splicing factor Syf1-like N-terminal HAT-repeats domain-containing protein n=1 Tax=Turnera subulata TaxID=218843 RepID=A0A9Q0FPB7_9ROSI|nr:hypothetical protein Tsubulata_020181 [Turnera subulata]